MSRRYENAKIYKLVSNKTADVYVGSCLSTLSARLRTHKNNLTCSSKIMFLVTDATIQIVLLEALPNCKSKAEMKSRELHYITTIPCINIRRPFVTNINVVGGDQTEWKKEYQKEYRTTPEGKKTIKAYRTANKTAIAEKEKAYRATPAFAEYSKEYSKANRDKINKRRRELYAANVPAVREQRKAYTSANAPAIIEKAKEYYAANKPAIAEKSKEYSKNNRDKINKRRRELRAAKKLTPAPILVETQLVPV